MDDEDKKHIWITGISASLFAVLFITTAVWHCVVVKIYTDAGYNRTTLPGASYTYWVKDKETPQEEIK